MRGGEASPAGFIPAADPSFYGVQPSEQSHSRSSTSRDSNSGVLRESGKGVLAVEMLQPL